AATIAAVAVRERSDPAPACQRKGFSTGFVSARGTGHPEHISRPFAPLTLICVAGGDEKKVRQAVEVAQRRITHNFLRIGPESRYQPLCPATNGPGMVEMGGGS